VSDEPAQSVEGVLTAWEQEVEEGTSDVGSILRAAGSRAAGPLLFLPALVMVSPIGAVPGVPLFLCTLIILVAAQVVAGRSSLWLPSVLIKRRIPEKKVVEVVEWLRPHAARADRYLGQRLTGLASAPVTRVIAGLCVLLALLVYPLTLLPLAVALPGSAIMFLSLGLLTRDGVVTLVGLAVAAAAFCTAVYLLV